MQKIDLLKLLLITTAIQPVSAFAQDTGAGGSPATAQAGPVVTDPQLDEEDELDDTDVSAPGSSSFGGDIVVQGRFIPNEIRATPQVVSVLSTEEIARSGDGDIAGALTRVTGLSIAGNGFVYVRGLGDRYSLALLNGSPLPSPEPLKRVVPLDLFPTSLLSSALVQKSYSVNYPGEFGGGVINLTTAAIPDESFIELKVGGAYHSETTGKLGYTYYGSQGDWYGFDRGNRSVPGPLRDAFASGQLITTDNFTLTELQDMATSLVNAPTSLLQSNYDIPANFSADLTAGFSTELGDGEFGVIATAGFSNSWKVLNSIQQEGTSVFLEEDYRTVRTNNNVKLTGLLGLGYEFGENNVIRMANVYIHDTLKQTRLARGFRFNSGDVLSEDGLGPRLEQRTAFYERQLIDIQGVAELEFGDLSVDLRGGYANSQRDAPYEREFFYYDNPGGGQNFVNNLSGDTQLANIAFSTLDEDVWSGGIDLSYQLPTERDIVLSAGYSYTDTKRNATRRALDFIVVGGQLFTGLEELRPDLLLSDAVIRATGAVNPETGELILGGAIVLNETTNTAGAAAYRGDLEVHGAYGKVEIELLDYVTAEVGVRYETADQSLTLPDVTGQGILLAPAPLNNDYWLPAATVTWNFAEDMQLRVHGSKTIARPQFRELAPQIFRDTDTDRNSYGNRFLNDSELLNFEARAEWYFDRGQRVSLAGFYKEIDNPIEVISSTAGDDLINTFANAPKAELYGAEFELVKYFPLYNLGGTYFESRRLVFIANYTYSKSKLKVSAGDTIRFDNATPNGLILPAPNYFRDGAPLTGQSEHLVNVQIGIEDEDRLSQYTFLLNYASERVSQRGAGLSGFEPDIIEKPGVILDFVAREGLNIAGQPFTMEFEVRNILDTRYSEFQRGDIFLVRNAYDLGTTVALSVSTEF